MRLHILALTFAVSLGFAVSGTAQEQLTTVAGQTYEGTVVSSDDTSVEFKTDEGMTLTLPVANLNALSQYMLKRKKVANDEKSQLSLAEWCVKNTLYQEARRHYQLALAADPEAADAINASIAKSRTMASEELLARAKKLMEENRPKDARQVLTAIVQELPEEAAAKEAGTMLAKDTEQLKANALKSNEMATGGSGDGGGTTSTGGPTRANGDEFSAEAQTLFAPVIKLYQSILDNTQKGLTETNQSRSISAYEAALKDGDRALKAVDSLRPKGTESEEVAEAVKLVDSKLESAIVDCRVQLANAYMLRTSYPQAADVVKAGLAQFPQNAQLNQTMSSVISAQSSDGIGGGWILRRGGVPVPSHRVR